jgi:hypothetical protein
MGSSTFRRSLAVLTFGLLGALTAFAVGARVGAALNGRVMGLTLANAPMPRLAVETPEPAAAATFAKK